MKLITFNKQLKLIKKIIYAYGDCVIHEILKLCFNKLNKFKLKLIDMTKSNETITEQVERLQNEIKTSLNEEKQLVKFYEGTPFASVYHNKHYRLAIGNQLINDVKYISHDAVFERIKTMDLDLLNSVAILISSAIENIHLFTNKKSEENDNNQ